MKASKEISIVYCHGVGGDPSKGRKVAAVRGYAAAHGLRVIAPHFDERASAHDMVRSLMRHLSSSNTDVVSSIFLGSSRGAFICAKASAELGDLQPGGMILLAPPVGIREDYYGDAFPTPRAGIIDVVHGYDDQVIPVRQVIDLCTKNRLRLHLVDEGHRLTEERRFIIGLLELQHRFIKMAMT